MKTKAIEANLPPALRGFAYQPFKTEEPLTLDDSKELSSTSGIAGVCRSANLAECLAVLLAPFLIASVPMAMSAEGNDRLKYIWWVILSGAGTGGLAGIGLYVRKIAGDNNAGRLAKKIFDQFTTERELDKLPNFNKQILNNNLTDDVLRFVTTAIKKKEGATILLVGPAGTGKTSTAEALASKLKDDPVLETIEYLKKEGKKVQVFKTSNNIFKSDQVSQIFECGPTEKILHDLKEIKRIAKENGTYPVVIFDEVPPSLFSGGRTAESRSEEANKMTEVIEEQIKKHFPGVVIFTCNTERNKISEHFRSGDYRLLVRDFNFPKTSDIVLKIKDIVGEKVSESDLANIGSCFELDESIRQILDSDNLPNGLSIDDKTLLLEVGKIYQEFDYRDVNNATAIALEEYEKQPQSGSGKSFEDILREKVIQKIVMVKLGDAKSQQFELLLKKLENYKLVNTDLNDTERVKIREILKRTLGETNAAGIGVVSCFSPSNKIIRVLEELDKTKYADRKLDNNYDYDEERVLKEYRDSYYLLTRQDVERAVSVALLGEGDKNTALTKAVHDIIVSRIPNTSLPNLQSALKKVESETRLGT